MPPQLASALMGSSPWTRNSGTMAGSRRAASERRRFGAVRVPDNFVRIGRKTFQECTAKCSSNCSCVAYAYATANESISNGDGTRCLVWIGDHRLVDAQKLGVRPYNTAGADSQETLYLRVAGMPSGNISYQITSVGNIYTQEELLEWPLESTTIILSLICIILAPPLVFHEIEGSCIHL